MKVAVYGASGRAGSRIVRELKSRGHEVAAISRTQDDLSDANRMSESIRGTDAVISAYAPPQSDTDQLVGVTERLIEAVTRAGVPRLLMVGGAGTLEVSPGLTLTDSGKLPPEWLPIARSHGKALETLQHSQIDWTSLSPAALFDPGERTGKFRVGTDQLIAGENGASRISMEDYAIAMVDELEQGKHRKQRFCVGY